MMDTLTCKFCRRTLSVTPFARSIRCLCGVVISVGNDQEPVSYGVSAYNLGFDPKTSKNSSLSPSSRSTEPPPKGKRAFLCGVTYNSKKFKLRGAAQDVMTMKNLLVQKFSFPEEAFLILAEEKQYVPPTKSNILEAFKWLMRDLQSGDSLVFYYSGHGLRQFDFKDEEIDGFDEAICPLDFETEGMILDNEINEMIVAPLPQEVTLHAIIDACHSGTVLDLPHVYNRNKGNWDLPLRVCKGTSGGKAICFSACEDYQLAADTSAFSSDETMAGAMTHTFAQAVRQKQEITYRGILDNVNNAIVEANKELRRGIRRLFQRQMFQEPILSSSEAFNIDTLFKL